MIILSGKYKGRKLKAPKGQETRPTTSIVRKALFDICAPFIEGSHFLDLFGGTGAIGFEALSRGAAHVTFCEQSAPALRALHDNATLLECTSQIKIYRGNALSILPKLKERFDIVYVDPPYGTIPLAELLLTLDTTPSITVGAHIFIESPYSADENWMRTPLQALIFKNTRRFGNTQLTQFYSNYSAP